MDAGLEPLIFAAVTVGVRAHSHRSATSIPSDFVTASSIPTGTGESPA